jgi:CheY-like chemotaxis protein
MAGESAKRKRVLVVEDEPAIAKVGVRALGPGVRDAWAISPQRRS